MNHRRKAKHRHESKSKSGASSFLVTTSDSVHTSSTPLSEASSYDDGPAETVGNREFPVVEQRLYVINKAGTGEASYLLLTQDARRILSYRVHTEKWRVTEGVINFSTVVLDTYVYVIGGFHTRRAACLSDVHRYDTCENEWSICSSMIQSRSKFGACVVDGKIFVCGGERTDGKITGSSEVYDPETDTWSKCGMLLAPRANCACAGYGNELFCAGGSFNGSAQNNLWIYEHHRWQEMDEDYPHQLPYKLDRCAIATVGNTFYFIGGVTTIESRHKSHRDDINNHNSIASNGKHYSNGNSLKVPSPGTVKTPDKPQKTLRYQTERRVFSYSTQISAGEKIKHGQQPDLISPWNFKLPPMIHQRHSAGAVAVGNKIHVVGGTSIETGQAVEVSETFDLLKGCWEEDFTLRKCDVSNVCCVLLEVSKIPPSDRRNKYRLRWVMW